MSQLLAELCHLLHIHSIETSPNHPQTDGQLKCFNQTLNSMLRRRAATLVVQQPHVVISLELHTQLVVTPMIVQIHTQHQRHGLRNRILFLLWSSSTTSLETRLLPQVETNRHRSSLITLNMDHHAALRAF